MSYPAAPPRGSNTLGRKRKPSLEYVGKGYTNHDPSQRSGVQPETWLYAERLAKSECLDVISAKLNIPSQDLVPHFVSVGIEYLRRCSSCRKRMTSKITKAFQYCPSCEAGEEWSNEDVVYDHDIYCSL